jgi:hypothetical protein
VARFRKFASAISRFDFKKIAAEQGYELKEKYLPGGTRDWKPWSER